MTQAGEAGYRFWRTAPAAAATVLVVLEWLGMARARAEDRTISVLLFGSLDAGASAFVTGGTKLTFDGVGRDGFALLASGGGGVRREPGPTIRGIGTTRMRQTALGAVLAGYEWFHEWGAVAAFVGPEGSIEIERSVAGTAVLPFRAGIRLHGEVWAHPTETTILTATAILGSTRQSAWGRLSWGTALWGAYIGPEVAGYVDGTGYARVGFGLHATDFRLGTIALRASLGLQTETDRGPSPYAALTVWDLW